MGKHIARLGAICVVGALALAPAAGAYKVPPPKGGGGTSKTPTKGVAKKLQNKTGKQLVKGIAITVHFPKAGSITCTVKGGGNKIGGGSVKTKKAGAKPLKITFTPAGKTFLKTGAGKKVTVTCTFKPTKGKSATSTVTVTLG